MSVVDTDARADTAGEQTVTAAELKQWRGTDPSIRLLDVRTTAEFEAGHIPGAVNIPLPQLAGVCEPIRDGLHGRLVMICQGGPRARQAHQMLQEHGCRQAAVLEGGMNSWTSAGGDVQHGRPRWMLERQVRLVAGSLVVTGILGSLINPRARLLSAAIGAGLVFSAVTDSCAMGNVLSRLPYNKGSRHDIDQAVAVLTGR